MQISSKFQINAGPVLIMILFAALSFLSCKKEDQPDPGGTPTNGLTFQTSSIDYVETAETQEIIIENGIKKIKKGSNTLRVFNFKNTSIDPIVITTAKGSSGAVVPTWPKEPILPGESNKIEVRYDTERTGPFFKYITIEASDNIQTYKLTIKGDIAE